LLTSNQKSYVKKPNIIKAWATAARLRTLPIPTVQVFTGTALAYSITGNIDWGIFLCTWFVGIFITMAVNLINDVIDFDKGADLPKRVGFLKVISAGIISRKHVLIAGILCLVLTALFGIPLAIHAGWPLYLLVLLSIAMAYCYTGGPYPLSYLGLSELFILIFYGGVCVGASYYVQAGSLSLSAVLCAMQMGLLAILPNALNNFRDMYDDAENQKLTLAVRFGRTFAKWEIAVLTFLPFILGSAWLSLSYLDAAWIPTLLLPMAFLFVRSVWNTAPGPLFNRLFGLSVLLHFLFGLFLAVGFFLK
jgi:1,4-dihydroxy-2-naphthoate polyprenyltransferase